MGSILEVATQTENWLGVSVSDRRKKLSLN